MIGEEMLAPNVSIKRVTFSHQSTKDHSQFYEISPNIFFQKRWNSIIFFEHRKIGKIGFQLKFSPVRKNIFTSVFHFEIFFEEIFFNFRFFSDLDMSETSIFTYKSCMIRAEGHLHPFRDICLLWCT